MRVKVKWILIMRVYVSAFASAFASDFVLAEVVEVVEVVGVVLDVEALAAAHVVVVAVPVAAAVPVVVKSYLLHVNTGSRHLCKRFWFAEVSFYACAGMTDKWPYIPLLRKSCDE
jgi:hypothetical protein